MKGIDRASHTKKDGVKDDCLSLQALAKNLMLFFIGLRCPGLVTSQYLTSTRCTFLLLTLSLWALRTSSLGCLGR